MQASDKIQNARHAEERVNERKIAQVTADSTNNVICCSIENHVGAFLLPVHEQGRNSGGLIWEKDFESSILTLHASNGYIVVGTTSKQIHLFSALHATEGKSVSSFAHVTSFDIPKKASAVSIVQGPGKTKPSSSGDNDNSGNSAESLHLLIADKFADVYSLSFSTIIKAGSHMSLSQFQEERHFLLQHPTSSITSLLAQPDLGWIATADQDEKIRVSRFPSTHLITSYCLGHTALVSSLALSRSNDGPSKFFLLSGGGDKSLRCWDPSNGKLLDTLIFLEHNQCADERKENEQTQLLVTSVLCNSGPGFREVTCAVINPDGPNSSIHSCDISEEGRLTLRSTQEWASSDDSGSDPDNWIVQDMVGVNVSTSDSGGFVVIALALNARTGSFEWLSLRDSIVTSHQLAPLSAWTDTHTISKVDGVHMAVGVVAEAPRGSRKRDREAAANSESRSKKMAKA